MMQLEGHSGLTRLLGRIAAFMNGADASWAASALAGAVFRLSERSLTWGLHSDGFIQGYARI